MEKVGEFLAQRVGQPEDDGDQQRIADLVDLDNKSLRRLGIETPSAPGSGLMYTTKYARLTPVYR